MSASELRIKAREEADELGPEPPGREADLWREERWGAVVLLAGLADDNVELLDEAARLLGYRRRGQAATPWSDKRLIRTAAQRADREAGTVVVGCDARRDRRVSPRLVERRSW